MSDSGLDCEVTFKDIDGFDRHDKHSKTVYGPTLDSANGMSAGS